MKRKDVLFMRDVPQGATPGLVHSVLCLMMEHERFSELYGTVQDNMMELREALEEIMDRVDELDDAIDELHDLFDKPPVSDDNSPAEISQAASSAGKQNEKEVPVYMDDDVYTPDV